MIFVTCLWRKILKYINSSCFSVQIPDNWKLIAVFSAQHGVFWYSWDCSARHPSWPSSADKVVFNKCSHDMTAGHVSCDINTSCRMQHAHHSDGPVRQRDRSSEQTSSRNNNDQCDMSWYPAVTQAVHSVCPHWRQLVVYANTWSKNKSISSQSQPQFLKGSLKVLCSAPCGSSHFLSVTWYDDDMIYISTSPALSPAVQIKGQSASLRVRADLRFVFLFFHHHTFVFLKRNEHYSLTAALMQIQIINYISHLKSRFFMSYVSVCWRYDALYIFSLGVVTTSLSHYLI